MTTQLEKWEAAVAAFAGELNADFTGTPFDHRDIESYQRALRATSLDEVTCAMLAEAEQREARAQA